MSKAQKIVLALLLLAGLVRLYRVTNPIADWHAFRQADTASVTREYVKHGVDWLRPRYHDLSNIQSGQANLEGYRMVEFPLINGLTALLLRAVPALPLVLTSRLLSIVASLGTLYFLIGLVKKLTNDEKMAWLTGLIFALMPYSIYYSRVVLPEPWLLFFSTGSLYLLTNALSLKKLYRSWQFWLSAVFLSLALLLKPFAIFLFPLYLVIIWPHKAKVLKEWWIWLIYVVITLLPIWWWRDWIQQFPSGIPASDWLLNGNGIRFRPAWWRWLFYERFIKLIYGFAGALLAAGALRWRGQGRAALWAWWLGLFAYAAVVATGNVQHDYYQVIFIPVLCWTLATGITTLWRLSVRNYTKLGIIGLALLTWWLSWQQISGYFNVNHWEYVEAGQAVDQLTPRDAKVIAPAFGDTHFLFQTNRTGWPIGFEIDDKISQGATHYVTTADDDEARMLQSRYQTLTKGERYLILDLTKPLEKGAQ